MNAIATVTSKGQVTLPRMVRKILGSRIIEFAIQGDQVLVKPVRSVAGSLASYTRKHGSLGEVREAVWREVAGEKARARSS